MGTLVRDLRHMISGCQSEFQWFPGPRQFLTHAMTAILRMPILGVAHVNVSGLFSRGAVWCCFGSRQNMSLTCCFPSRLNEIVSFRTQGSQAELREGVRAVEANETVDGERAPTIKRFALQD
jgi:hypothetical protein